MSFIGTAISLGVGAYTASQSGKQPRRELPDTVNAYGEVNTPDAAAIAARNKTFATMGSMQPRITDLSQQSANAYSDAARNPAFGNIQNYGSSVMRGDYLNSPIVNSYATQAANRIQAAGADTAARTRAAFGNQGMGLSTGMLQALQTGNTAAAAEAARARSGIQMQNYQAERTNQMAAPSITESAIAQPLSYAAAAPGALLDPLSKQAQITNTLLGGGAQASQPTLIQQPNSGQALANGISGGMSMYNMLNGMGGGMGGGLGWLYPDTGYGFGGRTTSGQLPN